MNLVKQEYIVTSAFNKDLALKALTAQLMDKIFADLINDEKPAIKLTFLLETIDESGNTLPG